MKYLQIKSATSTELGECVLPTMEKPYYSQFILGEMAFAFNGIDYAKAEDEYESHLLSLPKLPTTCTLPAGEWFDGRETNEVFSPDTSNWTEEDWKEAQAEAQRELPPTPRKVIVPVEQKEKPDRNDFLVDTGDEYFLDEKKYNAAVADWEKHKASLRDEEKIPLNEDGYPERMAVEQKTSKDFYSYLSRQRPDLTLGVAMDWFFGLCRTDMISHIEEYAMKSDSVGQKVESKVEAGNKD